jgi:hypothetical protein
LEVENSFKKCNAGNCFHVNFRFPAFFILYFSRQAILNDFFLGGGGARQLHPPLARTFGRAVSLMDSGETFFLLVFSIWDETLSSSLRVGR